MSTPSRFLSLPGEIRNRIYEEYAAITTTLRINIHGAAVPPALMQACQQITTEVRPIADQDIGHTVGFEAHVTDFDFQHVLAFIERIKSLSRGVERKLDITLRMTKPYDFSDRNGSLETWLLHVKEDREHLWIQDEASGTKRFRCREFTTILNTEVFQVTYEARLDWAHSRLTTKCCCICPLLEYEWFPFLDSERPGRSWDSIAYAFERAHRLALRPKIAIPEAAFGRVCKERRPFAKVKVVADVFVRELCTRGFRYDTHSGEVAARRQKYREAANRERNRVTKRGGIVEYEVVMQTVGPCLHRDPQQGEVSTQMPQKTGRC
ncbi:hypothetical protein LTR85_001232 [Meristemomyces frigidus]|nr:hypothetical protein LTR85_001232 [Meristemomyces frigidus]